jgi:hypothetical protein
MTLVALDLNATRVRAATGMSGADARPLALDGKQPELPMALSLEGRHAALGRAGTVLCRRSPHLACLCFLPYLGQRHEWVGPRLTVDADRALALMFEHIVGLCGKHQVVVAAVPGYLFPEQLQLVRELGEKAKLKLRGTVDVALAAALAAHALQPWEGLGLVADVDDHALTWSAVTVDGGLVRLLHSQSDPQLGLVAWKDRLLGAVSDAFIRKSRRDPRDSADAEQLLYDQLDGMLQACAEGFQAEIAVRSHQWYETMVFGAQDLAAAAVSLRDRATGAFNSLCHAAGQGAPRVVVLTNAAGRLPGLVSALEHYLADLDLAQEYSEVDDFGAGLLQEEMTPSHLQVLAPEAVAQATLSLAERMQHGALEAGHLEMAPPMAPAPPQEGQPRLRFRGMDHPLGANAFSMGRDPRCDLAFETDEYPSVSGRHCEIVPDARGLTLIDHSRHGTLVNNRPVAQTRVLQPGDWIRLGPGGPLIRFLGQPPDQRKLLPTA